MLAHHPHPAKPWHLRISTRGTHYRSHFITATDDPQQHLFSPHPKPVSWSLHHNPCLAARLCSPPDLTTRTTHPRSPPYPRVDHHPAAGERSPLPVTRLNPAKPWHLHPAAPLPGLQLSTRGTHQMHTPYRGEFITPRTRGTRARQLPNKSTSRQADKLASTPCNAAKRPTLAYPAGKPSACCARLHPAPALAVSSSPYPGVNQETTYCTRGTRTTNPRRLPLFSLPAEPPHHSTHHSALAS